MRKINVKFYKGIYYLLCAFLIISCANEDTVKPIDLFQEEESKDELDIFLKEEFRDPYGSNIIYKFVDLYIDPADKATPPRREVVKPIAELIKQAWIAPYSAASDQGEAFMKRYFPAEIIILGSPIYNGDGTITLGIADSGVRVTLTQANDYAPGNVGWIQQTFRTLHHEFAHIVDQNFNFEDLPYFQISEGSYTSPGTWSLENSTSAIEKGMVSPYGTSAVAEDFAEMVAFMITTPPDEFATTYLNQIDCSDSSAPANCVELNEGKRRIQEKYNLIVEYMASDVGIDILKLRDEFLKTLN